MVCVAQTTRHDGGDGEAVGKTVLVTGGSGLVGRYIVEALADHGEHVVGYTDTRATEPDQPTETALGEMFDLPRLLHVMREHDVQRLVHAADISDPRSSIAMPVATVIANVEGLLRLLEAARLAGIEGRIVLLSSSAVYGNNAGPIDECSPLRPRTPYAVTKVAGEQLGAVYADLYGLDIVALRIGEAFGPELELPSVLQAVLRSAVNGEVFRSAVGGDHTFHLTHGEDICRAVMASLGATNPSRRIYNITGGERHSLGQIVALIHNRFPQSRIEVGPGQLPALDRQGPLDIRAADRELGYRPLWGLARGLDDYVEWLLAEREAVTDASDGTPLVQGPVADQAALNGLLRKLHDLGLPLLSVTRIGPEKREAPAPDFPYLTSTKETP
jgi:UDP-glucose 4-epimerase